MQDRTFYAIVGVCLISFCGIVAVYAPKIAPPTAEQVQAKAEHARTMAQAAARADAQAKVDAEIARRRREAAMDAQSRHDQEVAQSFIAAQAWAAQRVRIDEEKQRMYERAEAWREIKEGR